MMTAAIVPRSTLSSAFVRQRKLNILRRRWHTNETSESSGETYTLLKAFGVGSVAGTLGSLAGMGGGFVMIPLMTSRLLRLTQHQAHGTSLVAVATTGAAGAISMAEHVEWESAAALAACGMLTARVGARMTTIMTARTLKRALGFIMLIMGPAVPIKGYMMQRHQEQSQLQPSLLPQSFTNNFFSSAFPVNQYLAENTAKLTKSKTDIQGKSSELFDRITPPATIGIISGFLAGLFGVGGGTVVVPALTLLTNCTHYQALATSLAAMTPTAVAGALTHHSAGNVAVRLAPALALGSFCGAYCGGKIGVKMDEDVLRWGFSGLLVYLGFRSLAKV